MKVFLFMIYDPVWIHYEFKIQEGKSEKHIKIIKIIGCPGSALASHLCGPSSIPMIGSGCM
jgi:hypothetical protein